MKVEFGSEHHERLKTAILSRFRMSREAFSPRHRAWAEVEDLYTAYVPLDEEEANRRNRQKAGETTFAQIVVPYSYATLLSAHTYWTAVFLGRDPVFQFTGRHGESQQQVQAIEALVDYQVQVGRMLPALYLWLLDAGKYGLGVVELFWDREIKAYTEDVEVTPEYLGVPQEPRIEPQTRFVVGYEGNRLLNVRPADFFPDPRVPVLEFQKGEFCARYTTASWNELLKHADEYFNLDVVRDKWENMRDVDRVASGVSVQMPASDVADTSWRRGLSAPVSVIEMFWELVPSEWDLGDSSFPEKWVFTLVGGEVLIGARPLGLAHCQFPFAILSYEMDGYSIAPRGILEILEPLERTLSWLVNSHLFNVRKAINDQLIVDPSRVVLRDLMEGGPGRLIRLNPTAYGSDVRTVVSQLPVVDVTRGHLESARVVIELMQRITGVTDNIMGMVNMGGRKTATEVRTSAGFGVNRLKSFSEFNSALGFSPLSQMIVQNTQQLMPLEQMYKVAGDLLAGDPKFIQVSREDITGFFDFVPVDGTMPIDRFAQAMLWKEILAGLAQMPQIAASYDIAGIFAWMAQISGLKNITQFKIAPDDVVRQQLSLGNIAPLGEFNGSSTNAAGGSPKSQIGPLAALGL